MRALVLLAVFCVGASPMAAHGEIFSDGFETGRTCWVWSRVEGGTELCFDTPFGTPPPVEMGTAEAKTSVRQADLIIGLDTTGSMGGEIANIKSSATTILDEFLLRVPDGAFGVAGYDDYPYGGYGSGADRAFYLLHRVMTASTPTGRNSIIDAIDQFQTHNGEDTPESGWEMVFQVASGAGSGGGAYGVPPFDPATAPPVPVPPDEEIGEIGGVGIRQGSLPILLWITDAPNHNSGGGSVNPYGAIPGVTPATSTQALSAVNAIGGRIIGIMSGEIARADLELGVTSTGALVTPDAWGTDSRPPGCSPTQCCTGIDGTGVPSNGGDCPLLFEIDGDGSGLGAAVVDGVERLIVDSGTFDIGGVLVDDPGDPIDTIDAFVDRLEADDSAPLPCTQGLTAVDVNPVDGVPDTFVDVIPGSTVCFNVVLKTNNTVPPTGEPQIFPAVLEIIADFVTVTETLNLFFRVSP